MNRVTPILLATLCALLAAFILVVEKDWRSTDEVRDRATRLYEIPEGDVAWISVKNPRDRFLLKKADGRWRIAEPVEMAADDGAVEALVRDIRGLEFERQFDAPDIEKGLEGYGLAPPTVVLRARWDGEEIELRLGARTPMGASVYAQTRKNVRRVYAIGADILETLSLPSSSWRSRRLADFEAERVEEIRLLDPTSKVRLERRGDRWTLKTPISARASAPRVRAILSAMARAQIERFVADDDSRLQDFGLREPRLTVHLEVRDGDDAEVQFGAEDPERPGAMFARRPGSASIVSVSTNLLAELAITAEALRDRRLIPVEAQAVERVVLTRGPLRMEAIREKGTWKIVQPGELEMSPANDDAVTRFVRRCCELQVSRFVADAVTDPSKLGLDKPAARVELWTKAGPEPSDGQTEAGGRRLEATLLVSPPADDLRHCVVEPEPFVLGVAVTDLAHLEAQPWDWRGTAVWHLDGPVRAFSVQRGATTCRLSRSRSGWVADPPEKVDQATAASISDLLANLRAQAWLGPTLTQKLDAPDLTFAIEDGAILRIWRDGPRWIAWAEGGGAPDLFFEMSSAEAGLLGHPVLDVPSSPRPTDAP
ncbi:MAG: DUF4340 domain-containing protein [Verrucomicrobiae bacterium]|nr:DUF4340 domain-containing protein [Verrucomicrobiae bacterium]